MYILLLLLNFLKFDGLLIIIYHYCCPVMREKLEHGTGLRKSCLFIQNGSHASRSGEEGQHLPLPVSACGASSRRVQRRLRSTGTRDILHCNRWNGMVYFKAQERSIGKDC